MANRIKTWTAEILTASDLNAEFNQVYGGSIDRTAGRWGSNDDIPVTFGSSQDASLTWNTAQTQDALILGLGASNHLIVCEEADKTTNFGYSSAPDPTLYLHSNSTTANRYMALYHNDSNAYIKIGYGTLTFTIGSLSPVYIDSVAESPFLSLQSLDLGDGITGPILEIGRNGNVTNASAGSIKLVDKGGTPYYLWVDDSGILRIGAAAPTTATDTSGGDIVGEQGT